MFLFAFNHSIGFWEKPGFSFGLENHTDFWWPGDVQTLYQCIWFLNFNWTPFELNKSSFRQLLFIKLNLNLPKTQFSTDNFNIYTYNIVYLFINIYFLIIQSYLNFLKGVKSI